MQRSAPPRLKRRPEFLAVAAANRKFVTPSLILQGLAHETPGQATRVGFTVSRKVGNAVIRNRVRRRLRAVVQDRARMGFPDNFDLVVIGRHAALDRSYADLIADFDQALRRLCKC